MRSFINHRLRTAGFCLLTGWVLGLQGCGPREVPPATPPAPAAEVKPGAAPADASNPGTPAPTPAAKPVAPPAAQPAASPAPAPAASAASSAPAPVAVAPPPAPEAKPTAVTAPTQAAGSIGDPGGEVAVKPAKAGLTRVGSNACKLCHRVQFASWSESPHAKRNPPLDCEGCHGAGSEYKAMATMKDSAKASAAGLVRPGAPFCATCHTRGWSDGMLKKAHAHKG